MSQDVLSMLQKMDTEDVELQMAIQCAPLFSGLKIANLLIVSSEHRSQVLQILKHTNISHLTLSEYQGKITMLLYRSQELQDYFSNPKVRNLLHWLGYENQNLYPLLIQFRKKFQYYQETKGDFPHEMGLFLGYPVEDVAGFIKHQGKKALYTGYWKVYRDLHKKKLLFKEFEQAQDNIITLLCSGGSVRQVLASC